MVAFSIDNHEIELPGGFTEECETCGPQVLHPARLDYTSPKYIFVFGFIRRIEIFGRCPGCDATLRVPEAYVPPELRDRVPFLHRYGCLTIVIAGVIFGAVMFLLNNF